jgi:hypothetical protein
LPRFARAPTRRWRREHNQLRRRRLGAAGELDVAITSSEPRYEGDDYFSNPYNPGFGGMALERVATVGDPPSTLLLLGMSLTGLVAVRRRWRYGAHRNDAGVGHQRGGPSCMRSNKNPRLTSR